MEWISVNYNLPEKNQIASECRIMASKFGEVQFVFTQEKVKFLGFKDGILHWDIRPVGDYSYKVIFWKP